MVGGSICTLSRVDQRLCIYKLVPFAKARVCLLVTRGVRSGFKWRKAHLSFGLFDPIITPTYFVTPGLGSLGRCAAPM